MLTRARPLVAKRRSLEKERRFPHEEPGSAVTEVRPLFAKRRSLGKERRSLYEEPGCVLTKVGPLFAKRRSLKKERRFRSRGAGFRPDEDAPAVSVNDQELR